MVNRLIQNECEETLSPVPEREREGSEEMMTEYAKQTKPVFRMWAREVKSLGSTSAPHPRLPSCPGYRSCVSKPAIGEHWLALALTSMLVQFLMSPGGLCPLAALETWQTPPLEGTCVHVLLAPSVLQGRRQGAAKHPSVDRAAPHRDSPASDAG